MFRSALSGVLVTLVTLAFVCGAATASPQRKVPTGSVKWDYDVMDQDDKRVEKGTFFARGLALFNKQNRRIGTYEIDPTDTEVKVTMLEGKLKGKLDLRRESPTSLTFKGELERGSGLKYKVTVVFEKIK
jgi:hypothetical protein